jgi:hypothetical protein
VTVNSFALPPGTTGFFVTYDTWVGGLGENVISIIEPQITVTGSGGYSFEAVSPGSASYRVIDNISLWVPCSMSFGQSGLTSAQNYTINFQYTGASDNGGSTLGYNTTIMYW